MIVKQYERTEEGREEWMQDRLGRITGTRDIIPKRGTEPKMGFWEIIAEKIAIPPNEENPMDRGKRLEEIAIDRFMKETGIEVCKDFVLISREDYPDIAYSPDGTIGDTASVEVKCLKSSLHVKAVWNKEIPKEYEDQSIQPFVVNDKLETLYFVFYDPRMPVDFYYITLKREEIKTKYRST
jgi:hypothetical protein